MHYTWDGVEIVEGLRVFTNECKWGTVGKHKYDGWFDVDYDDGGRTLMNGERLRTTEMPR